MKSAETDFHGKKVVSMETPRSFHNQNALEFAIYFKPSDSVRVTCVDECSETVGRWFYVFFKFK